MSPDKGEHSHDSRNQAGRSGVMVCRVCWLVSKLSAGFTSRRFVGRRVDVQLSASNDVVCAGAVVIDVPLDGAAEYGAFIAPETPRSVAGALMGTAPPGGIVRGSRNK
ncbi:MAG: hypothetical protein JWM36_3412 [Hyphomicrobiales bacterium]|nr:hypothetical protein [Hyphomicrobiales bacterium]